MAVATGTLRIGVLGVGRIGRMHAELLERQVPGAAISSSAVPVAGTPRRDDTSRAVGANAS